MVKNILIVVTMQCAILCDNGRINCECNCNNFPDCETRTLIKTGNFKK